jgi:hypothetical protein
MVVNYDKFDFCHWIKDMELFLIWNFQAIRVGGKKPWKIPGEDHFSGMLDVVFMKEEPRVVAWW